MPSTQSKLSKLKLKPGFHRESTQYSEEGTWYDGDRVRFREGKPENLRGYKKNISIGLEGTARDTETWANNNTEPLLAVGTNQRLSILYGDVNYDVTPVVTTVSIGDSGSEGSFDTIAGSYRVGVSLNTHGVSVGDWVVFSSVSINGFNNDGSDFSAASFGGPTFPVVSVGSINKFFVSTVSVATSTEANQGHGTLKILLANENRDNIQGLGYGAGVYIIPSDSGTTDGTTANKLVDSTKSFLSTVAINDLVTNVTDTTSATVTAIDSDTQLTLDTDIMASGEEYIIYDPASNNTRAWNEPAASSDINFQASQWSLDTFGEDLLAVRRGSQLFHWDADVSTLPVRTSIVATGPTKINSIVVSPNDRHVIALGTNEAVTSVFNPLLIRWGDQETYSNWEPSISSTAGEIQLIDGTQIIGGIRTRNAIGVWTDTAAYSLQFVGPPFIFRLTQLGTNCGLIGPHAAVDVDGRSYWMGDNDFFVFDGRVRTLDCSIRRYLYEDFNNSQSDKVYAGVNSEFHEVIWLYPKSGEAEPNAYVIYNYAENLWVYGTGFFSTYEDKDTFNNVITTGAKTGETTSFIWDNEPSETFDGDGEALTSYIESADFDINDGDDLMFINKLIPDFTVNTGYVKFTVQTKNYPAEQLTTKGPFSIDNGTTKINMRARGRQARVRVSTASSGISWKYGSMRLAMQRDGKR